MHAICTLTMNPAVDIFTDVPLVVPTHKLRCSAIRQDPGGGGINCARVISRLGGMVTAIYPMGGATGQLLKKRVEAEGILSLTIDAHEETRLSFTVLEKDTENEFRFVLPGPHLNEAEWKECLAAVSMDAVQPQYLIASGSMPPGVPDDFLPNLARMAKARGIRLVLDTSGAALKETLAAGVYLVKPNLREMRELTGNALDDETSWIAACRDLIAKGQAEMVALTLGHLGALLVTRDLALRAEALPIKPVSTVGAGDSFLGALVWSISRGDDLEKAFRYGVAAGSAALLSQGTGLCAVEDVEKLVAQTNVTRL